MYPKKVTVKGESLPTLRVKKPGRDIESTGSEELDDIIATLYREGDRLYQIIRKILKTSIVCCDHKAFGEAKQLVVNGKECFENYIARRTVLAERATSIVTAPEFQGRPEMIPIIKQATDFARKVENIIGQAFDNLALCSIEDRLLKREQNCKARKKSKAKGNT